MSTGIRKSRRIIAAFILAVFWYPLLSCSSEDNADGHKLPTGSSPAHETQAPESDISLLLSTFLSPTSKAEFSELWEATTDSAGNIIVAGMGDFSGLQDEGGAIPGVQVKIFDANAKLDTSSFFVIKLTKTGKPAWIAVLDGTGPERQLDGLGLDSADNIIISGTTQNPDFPTTAGAFDTSINSTGNWPHSGDAFVAKISADGSRLLFSTFLGGKIGDSTSRGGVTVANNDSIYVVGHTKASDFLKNPDSGAEVPVRQGYHGGIGDGFVLRLSADGSKVDWVTFIGSATEKVHGDVVVGLDIGPGNKPYIAALVRGNDLPTTEGVHSRTYSGGISDAYAARLSPDGQLEWATYIGGSGEDVPEHGVRVDNVGNMIFSGGTLSSDWPVVNANQPVYGGGGDGYLVKLDPSGRIVFSTYTGGVGEDSAIGAGIDGKGRIFIGGNTRSEDFPVSGNAFDSDHNGDQDVFGRIYDKNGKLLYSTLLGGSDWDRCRFGTATPEGDMILIGTTRSTDFPVSADAFSATHNGQWDIFLTRLRVNW